MSAMVVAPAYRGLGLNVPTRALVIMGWGAGVATEFGGGDEPTIKSRFVAKAGGDRGDAVVEMVAPRSRGTFDAHGDRVVESGPLGPGVVAGAHGDRGTESRPPRSRGAAGACGDGGGRGATSLSLRSGARGCRRSLLARLVLVRIGRGRQLHRSEHVAK